MIRILAAVLIGLLFDGLTRAPTPPPPAEVAETAETVAETVVEAVEAEEAEADEPLRLTEEVRAAAIYIAKTLHGECKDCTKTEQAAVAWCILNRVDSEPPYRPDDIVSVVTQP